MSLLHASLAKYLSNDLLLTDESIAQDTAYLNAASHSVVPAKQRIASQVAAAPLANHPQPSNYTATASAATASIASVATVPTASAARVAVPSADSSDTASSVTTTSSAKAKSKGKTKTNAAAKAKTNATAKAKTNATAKAKTCDKSKVRVKTKATTKKTKVAGKAKVEATAAQANAMAKAKKEDKAQAKAEAATLLLEAQRYERIEGNNYDVQGNLDDYILNHADEIQAMLMLRFQAAVNAQMNVMAVVASIKKAGAAAYMLGCKTEISKKLCKCLMDDKTVISDKSTAKAVDDLDAAICVVELCANRTKEAQSKTGAVGEGEAGAVGEAEANAAAGVNGVADSYAFADDCGVQLHDSAVADHADAQSAALRGYRELSAADKATLQEIASLFYAQEREERASDRACAAQCELYAPLPRPCVYSSDFGGQVAAYSSDFDDADEEYGASWDDSYVEEEEEEEEVSSFAYSDGYVSSNGSEVPAPRSAWGCEDVYDSSDRSDNEHSLEARTILKGDLDEVLLSETSSEWSCFDKRIVKDCEAHLIDNKQDQDFNDLSDSMYIADTEQDVDAPAYIWPVGSSRIREQKQAAAAETAAAVTAAATANDAFADTAQDAADAADECEAVDVASAVATSEAVEDREVTALDSSAVAQSQANVTTNATVALSPDLSVQVSVSMPRNTNCKISLESHIDAVAQEAKILDFDACTELGAESHATAQKPVSIRQALLAESDNDARSASKTNAAITTANNAAVESTAVPTSARAGSHNTSTLAQDSSEHKAKDVAVAVSVVDAEALAVANDAAAAETEISVEDLSVANDATDVETEAEIASEVWEADEDVEDKLADVEDRVAQERYAKLQSVLKQVKEEDRHLCPIAMRMAEMSKDSMGFGTAQAYDAVDALSVKVPFAQRMCPQGFVLEQRSWTDEINSYSDCGINAQGTKGFLKSGLSRRALDMLANSSVKLFADKDEAFYALLQVLTLPVIELMGNSKVTTIALGTDTRVLYKNKRKTITVLPAVDQNNINLLARELVYLNAPERIHDHDISDLIGRVGIGGFYFKCDVPPHSLVPVVTMWRVCPSKEPKLTRPTTTFSAPIEPNTTLLRPSSFATAQQPSSDTVNASNAANAAASNGLVSNAAASNGLVSNAASSNGFTSDAADVFSDAQSCVQQGGVVGGAAVQTHHSVPSSDSGSTDTEDVSWTKHSASGATAHQQAQAAKDSKPDHSLHYQAKAQVHQTAQAHHGDFPSLHQQGSVLEDEWLDAESRADAEAEVAAILLKAAANESSGSSHACAAASASAAAQAAAAVPAAGAAVGARAGVTLIGRMPPGPPIEAAQDDPGVYAVTDCRYDLDALKHRPLSAAQQHTIEYCGAEADKHEGRCPIASELGLSLRLSDRAWKMMEKIDSKWRSGNYNIESLRMLTFLIGPVILELLANPEVTEIAVNSDKRLFVNTYTQRSIELQNSQSTYMDALMRLLSSMLDITLTPDKHILSGILPIDGSRVECNRPPVVPNPTLVIRKHSACSLTLDRLMDLDMLNLTQYILLEHALKDRLSILVSGETGSGKTTLLSALINQLADIYPRERVICLEDTPELQPQIANCTHAYTSDSTSMSQLVCSALRQHPDRIVVGEVRGPEALDLIDALSTGHKGSFSSMHAGSPEEAVKRLGLMISRNPEAPENYNDLIVGAIDLIIQMESRPNPHIRCIECITGIDENGICVQPLRSAAELSGFKNSPND